MLVINYKWEGLSRIPAVICCMETLMLGHSQPEIVRLCFNSNSHFSFFAHVGEQQLFSPADQRSHCQIHYCYHKEHLSLQY